MNSRRLIQSGSENVRASKGREDFIEKVKDNYALRSTIHKKLSSYVEVLKDLNQSGKKLNITTRARHAAAKAKRLSQQVKRLATVMR